MSIAHRNFDQDAENWDKRPQRVRLANEIADAIVRQLPQTASLDVLDFGCGTGLLTLRLHPLVHSITGVDSSAGMLDVLNRKVVNLKVANVRTMLCDLEQDADFSGKYDLIVSSMTFHHIRRIEPLLARFYAVLAPGGRLCVADLDLEQGRFHSDNTGVFHFGFDRTTLSQAFIQAGFGHVGEQTATHINKTDTQQQPTCFSVFLLTGEKAGPAQVLFQETIGAVCQN